MGSARQSEGSGVFEFFLGFVFLVGIFAAWIWWGEIYGSARAAVGHPLPTSVPIPVTDPAEVERWVALLVNESRTGSGLPPLNYSSQISAIARQHSENMMQQGQQSHELDGLGPSERGREAGFNCHGLAENIVHHYRVRSHVGATAKAWDADSKAVAQRLMRSWMMSPGHRDNILNPRYRGIGVGVAVDLDADRGAPWEIVWATQNFSPC